MLSPDLDVVPLSHYQRPHLPNDVRWKARPSTTLTRRSTEEEGSSLVQLKADPRREISEIRLNNLALTAFELFSTFSLAAVV